MTKIGEVNKTRTKLDIEATVISLTEPRTVNLRAGGSSTVCDAIIKDPTGTMKLALWDSQIKMVKEGSEIKIENGYVTEFKGECVLNVGKFGRLGVIEF